METEKLEEGVQELQESGAPDSGTPELFLLNGDATQFFKYLDD
jgi:hypothetical protein